MSIPVSLRRRLDRAINEALHPKGMHTNGPNYVRGVTVDELQYLLRIIDNNNEAMEFIKRAAESIKAG